MFCIFLIISLVTRSLFFGSTTRWKLLTVAALVLLPTALIRYWVAVEPGQEVYLANTWIVFFGYTGIAMAMFHEFFLLLRGMSRKN